MVWTGTRHAEHCDVCIFRGALILGQVFACAHGLHKCLEMCITHKGNVTLRY